MAMAPTGGVNWADIFARMLAQRGASGNFPGSMANTAMGPSVSAAQKTPGPNPAIDIARRMNPTFPGMMEENPLAGAPAVPTAKRTGLAGSPGFNVLMGGLGRFGAALAPENHVAQSLGGLAGDMSQGNLVAIQRGRDQSDPNAPPVMGLDPRNALASWEMGQGERALADRAKARQFEQDMAVMRNALEESRFQKQMEWDAQTRAEDRNFKLEDRMFEREFQNRQLSSVEADRAADNARAEQAMQIQMQQLALSRSDSQRDAQSPYAAGQWGAIMPGPSGPKFIPNPYDNGGVDQQLESWKFNQAERLAVQDPAIQQALSGASPTKDALSKFLDEQGNVRPEYFTYVAGQLAQSNPALHQQLIQNRNRYLNDLTGGMLPSAVMPQSTPAPAPQPAPAASTPAQAPRRPSVKWQDYLQ